jgi:mannose-6-phosphate isomerase-like protein (cupin superfamily)
MDMRPLKPLLALPVIMAVSTLSFVIAQGATPEYISADRLADAVAGPTDNAIASQMNTDPGTLIWSIKRKKSGEVEVHRTWNDVILAKEGTITILVGERVEGNREIKPNEWLGGKILGGREYTLKAGDILFIPAGLGHQMLLVNDQPFTYLVIKTAAQAAPPH